MLKNLSQEVKVIGGITLVTLVILIVGAILLGNGSSNASTDLNSAPLADNSKLITKESYQTMPKGAKVTLVEFADFECPGCGEMYPVVKQLQKDYAGKINIVYHNFPLPMHQFGKVAAQAAVAAGNQGKFWEMHDLLFANQADWSLSKDVPTAQATFAGYAKQLKLNLNKYNQDVNSAEVMTRINNDVADGNAVGIDSTPTFYINQHKYLGDYSLTGLKNAIDGYLK